MCDSWCAAVLQRYRLIVVGELLGVGLAGSACSTEHAGCWTTCKLLPPVRGTGYNPRLSKHTQTVGSPSKQNLIESPFLMSQRALAIFFHLRARKVTGLLFSSPVFCCLCFSWESSVPKGRFSIAWDSDPCSMRPILSIRRIDIRRY